MRLSPAIIAAAMVMLLGGCAGDTALTTAVATGTVAQGEVISPDVSSQPKARQTFSPFRDPTATEAAVREIIQNPTLAEVLKPGPLAEIAVGRADAPVTLIKYMSLTCPYCRQFQLTTYPELKRRYIDTGKVRLILREFPIGFQSGAATIALRCVAPEKYVQTYERFLSRQGQWASQEVRLDPIFKIVAEAGVSRAAFDACRQDAQLIEGLKAVKERGRLLGIVGTPNFFVNERLVKTVVDIKTLGEMIDAALAGQTPQAMADKPRA